MDRTEQLAPPDPRRLPREESRMATKLDIDTDPLEIALGASRGAFAPCR
jgi:hypothetical protein